MRHYIWATCWAIVVLVLCCMPLDGTERVPRFEGMDKLVHTGFFFVFTVLLYNGSIHQYRTHRPKFVVLLKIILISLLFAAFTEFLQWKLFVYRSGDLWDLFADAVGTGMGVFAYLILHRVYRN